MFGVYDKPVHKASQFTFFFLERLGVLAKLAKCRMMMIFKKSRRLKREKGEKLVFLLVSSFCAAAIRNVEAVCLLKGLLLSGCCYGVIFTVTINQHHIQDQET